MAALYLHNAIWAPPEQVESAQSTSGAGTSSGNGQPQRPRRLHSLSSGTLRTVSPDFSYPTEPLLRDSTSESIAYKDMLARQPAHPDGPRAGWDIGLSLEGDQLTHRERKTYRELSLRRRLRKLRIGKGILELVFAAWALYNLVRYFLAYNIYTSQAGQTFSLALGTSATLSFAFVLSAALISAFRHYLLLHHVSIGSILVVRNVLQVLLSVFLVVPAFVSFVLVFTWNRSSDPELRLGNRCYVDIDVVWSVSRVSCDSDRSPRFGFWVTLSLIRLILTIADVVLYHVLSRAYYKIRRPSWSRKATPRSLRLPFRNAGSVRESFRRSSPFQPLACTSSNQLTSPPSTLPKHPQATVSTKHTGDYRSLRSHSRSGGSRTLTNNSPSFVEKELPPTPEYDIYANFDPAMPFGPDEVLNDLPPPPSSRDSELTGFVDRFRSLVAQIARETESAMTFARPGSETSSAPPSTPSSSSMSPVFNPYQDYGGQPLPPSSLPMLPPPLGPPTQVDERVRVMGSYVRRMPTIESLGSREMGSVAHSSVHRAEGGSGGGGGSRSPTVETGTGASRRSTRHSMNSVMSSSASSRLSAYHTNSGHQVVTMVGGAGAGRVRDSLDGGPSPSFHTAGSTASSSSSQPPPVPPKEPRPMSW